LTGWVCRACHDLKLSNRLVRTRMPGGVAGAQPIMAVPYADLAPRQHRRRAQRTISV